MKEQVNDSFGSGIGRVVWPSLARLLAQRQRRGQEEQGLFGGPAVAGGRTVGIIGAERRLNRSLWFKAYR
jgi:hypothetical protein